MREKVALCVLVLTFGLSAHAGVLVNYQANADPTAVGWTAGNNHPEYPPTLTAGTETDGTKYWEVVDGPNFMFNYSNAGGLSYGNTRGSAEGWTYTAKIKVISSTPGYDPVPYSISLKVIDNYYFWTMCLTDTGVYAEYDGALQLMKAMNTTDGYHTYQMIYSGGEAGTMSIYVDGVLAGSYSSSQTFHWDGGAGYVVVFGSQDTSAASDARWNQVTVETGQKPVPVTLASYKADADPATVGWTAGNNNLEYPPTLTAGTDTDGTKYWEIVDSPNSMFNYSTPGGLHYGNTRGCIRHCCRNLKPRHYRRINICG